MSRQSMLIVSLVSIGAIFILSAQSPSRDVAAIEQAQPGLIQRVQTLEKALSMIEVGTVRLGNLDGYFREGDNNVRNVNPEIVDRWRAVGLDMEDIADPARELRRWYGRKNFDRPLPDEPRAVVLVLRNFHRQLNKQPGPGIRDRIEIGATGWDETGFDFEVYLDHSAGRYFGIAFDYVVIP